MIIFLWREREQFSIIVFINALRKYTPSNVKYIRCNSDSNGTSTRNPVTHVTHFALAMIISTKTQTKSKRRATQTGVLLLVLAAVIVAIQARGWRRIEQAISSSTPSATETIAANNNEENGFQMAFQDSFGFFDDIPNEQWMLRKQLTNGRIHNLDLKSKMQIERDAIGRHPYEWYQFNWDPDFSCFHEDSLGGPDDGHKWVCDPTRLRKAKDCLVYSVGSHGNFAFEADLQRVAPNCEIHVFDPDNFKKDAARWRVNVTYHQWGLKPSYKSDPNVTETPKSLVKLAAMDTKGWKTIQQTMKELGHEKRKVDIFKIDCEGCEFRSYKDWLSNIDIGQLLVETHRVPAIANQFFQDLHDAGFAMFHKEPNTASAKGECVEFSFIRLKPSFFDKKAQ